MTEAIRQGIITSERAEFLLSDLREYLLRHWITLADANEENLLWQQRSDGSARLVIIDGLGARHCNMKLWLRMHVPFLARYKLRRKWPRVLEKVRNAYAKLEIAAS